MKILPYLGAAVAAATAVGVGLAITGNFAQAADADAPSSLVEDFTHPGAATILEQYEIKVFKGDGHIMFAERRSYDDGQCTVGQIQVEKSLAVEPYGYFYCFKTVGTKGFLTLEVPATFGVRGGSVPLQATAMLPEGNETYQIAPNQPVAISPGSGDEMPKAVLVELRLTGN
jgi:hypothetical protein